MRGKRATAQAWGSLDQDYGAPRLADPERGRQARESGAHDDDIRMPRRSRLGGGGQLLSGGRCHLRSKRRTPQRARARRHSRGFDEISPSDFFTHVVFENCCGRRRIWRGEFLPRIAQCKTIWENLM
jgi:hypothetical protein